MYIGGYLHADCSGLSSRDIVRLATVLIYKEKIMDILDGMEFHRVIQHSKLLESWGNAGGIRVTNWGFGLM